MYRFIISLFILAILSFQTFSETMAQNESEAYLACYSTKPDSAEKKKFVLHRDWVTYLKSNRMQTFHGIFFQGFFQPKDSLLTFQKFEDLCHETLKSLHNNYSLKKFTFFKKGLSLSEFDYFYPREDDELTHFKKYIVFSDSFSKGFVIQKSIEGYPYKDGRKSNGKVWHEYLEKMYPGMLGKSFSYDEKDFKSHNILQKKKKIVPELSVSIVDLVKNYVKKDLKNDQNLKEDSLYTLWVSGLEYPQKMRELFSEKNEKREPSELVRELNQVGIVEKTIQPIFDALEVLYYFGGRYFLVPNSIDLSLTPLAQEKGIFHHVVLKYLNEKHNLLLSERLSRFRDTHSNAKFILVDMHFHFQQFYENPEFYGFTHVKNIYTRDTRLHYPQQACFDERALLIRGKLSPDEKQCVDNGYMYPLFETTQVSTFVHCLLAHRVSEALFENALAKEPKDIKFYLGNCKQ